MNKVRFALNTLAVLMFTLTVASMAQAQATRTWVSGVGDDVNPCSRTAPCKTFAGAISKTAAGGEIDALDPGGFGTLTCTKSITVDGAGTLASALSGSVAAFIINDGATATPGTIVVRLRNLTINGTTLGTNGVNYISGKSVTVENCVIANFSTNGIRVSLTTNGNLKVINTTIESITGDGINIGTTVGQVLATVDNSRILSCGGDGFEASNHSRSSITNSVLNHNTSSGIRTSGTDNIVNVDDSSMSYSTTGAIASSGSTISVSDCFIAQNGTGVNANGGTLNSFQGNSLVNNGVPGSFTGVATPKQ
jgi:hypothetical protein